MKYLLLLGLLILGGCSFPLTPELISALKNDPASFCMWAKANGAGAAIAAMIPAGGYGSADLVICRSNEAGSEIILAPDGTLTLKHGKSNGE